MFLSARAINRRYKNTRHDPLFLDSKNQNVRRNKKRNESHVMRTMQLVADPYGACVCGRKHHISPSISTNCHKRVTLPTAAFHFRYSRDFWPSPDLSENAENGAAAADSGQHIIPPPLRRLPGVDNEMNARDPSILTAS